MRTDIEIRNDVMAELEWQAAISAYGTKPAEIGVTVKSGIVTLTGTVDRFAKKNLVEEAAMKIAGVRAIANDIEVRLSDNYNRNDTDIAEVILHTLKWNTSVPEDKIKVKVEDGWITLEGKVEWEFQKTSIEEAVENITGVIGISNMIVVNSKVPTSDGVKNKIMAAFIRNHYLDANKIKVEISDNTAVLRGQVRNIAEKREAERATWFAPGITRVENKLEVESEILHKI